MIRTPRTAVLLVLVLALGACTMVLPWPVAAWVTGATWTGPDALADAVRLGLVTDWTRGIAVPGEGASALTEVTQFWRWFHLVKAVLAVAVLIASGLFIARWWGSRVSAGTRARRISLLLGCGAAGALAMLALVVAIANVQGAIAPLSSVLSFLTTSRRDGDLTATVDALRDDLMGTHPSATAVTIIRDFSSYHVVVAVLSAATAVVVAVLAVRLLRRHERTAGAVLIVVALGFALLTAANVSTAMHPAPAFASFLAGGAT